MSAHHASLHRNRALRKENAPGAILAATRARARGGRSMARSTAVELLDDIDGEPAEETVRFALDGVEYDIDLSGDNADTLRTILGRYVEGGRRTGGRKRRPRIIGKPKARKRTPAKTAGNAAAAKSTARTKQPAKKATATRTSSAKAASGAGKARTTKATTAGTKAATTKTTGTKAAGTKRGSGATAAKTTSTAARTTTAKNAAKKATKPAARKQTGGQRARTAKAAVPQVTFSAAK
ncbi:Lsr2 dimerization domain-containing protein [Prauserella muralis]|nr:histone-like nucleoid-structuring protein Lsr2 [Prauserella muralis]